MYQCVTGHGPGNGREYDENGRFCFDMKLAKIGEYAVLEDWEVGGYARFQKGQSFQLRKYWWI